MEKLYNIKTAHMFSSQHRKQLDKTKSCGCFYCGKIFSPKEIIDWCDNEDTAICPYCGVDSLLPEQEGIHLTKEFLSEMNKYWF